MLEEVSTDRPVTGTEAAGVEKQSAAANTPPEDAGAKSAVSCTPAGDLPSGAANSASLPGVANSASLPGVANSAGLPGVANSAGLPGVANSAGLPGAANSAGLPGVANSASLPGVANSAGLPGAATATMNPRPKDRIRIGSQREKAEPTKPKPMSAPTKERQQPAPPPVAKEKVPLPNLRDELPPDLEQEVAAALSEAPVEQIMRESGPAAGERALELGDRLTGTVTHANEESVFLDLGGRNQGILPRAQFTETPAEGLKVDVIVHGQNSEDGLYELTVPGGTVSVEDWSQLAEGMVVEARITGMNTGGLECDVNGIRGFIPASQIALFRVENLAEFIEQRLPCVVTEASPRKKNLVLSRRAVLEREKAEAREKVFAELEVGQIREGVVRKLCDFGAFVDLGGVDGLIHVSQMSWDHIKHPNEVLQNGQKVRVKIQKIDPQTRKIGLAYRDLTESPWVKAEEKYPVGGTVKGTVSKLMDFGVFVRLEPGIEGLIHISELAHKRVNRASEVVQEGQELEIKVLSVDTEQQRIGLSLKALQARPEPEKRAPEREEEPPPDATKRRPPKKNLKGGVGGKSGGEQFGLRW